MWWVIWYLLVGSFVAHAVGNNRPIRWCIWQVAWVFMPIIEPRSWREYRHGYNRARYEKLACPDLFEFTKKHIKPSDDWARGYKSCK